MPYVQVETRDGPQPVKVCDHCRTVCCQSRYCSGRCARQAAEWARFKQKQPINPKE